MSGLRNDIRYPDNPTDVFLYDTVHTQNFGTDFGFVMTTYYRVCIRSVFLNVIRSRCQIRIHAGVEKKRGS